MNSLTLFFATIGIGVAFAGILSGVFFLTDWVCHRSKKRREDYDRVIKLLNEIEANTRQILTEVKDDNNIVF